MKKYKFVSWSLIDGISDEVYVESIKDDSDGLRILISSEGKTVRILFKNKISYKVSQESYLLKLWNEIEIGKEKLVFYKIENSWLIDDFNENTLNIYSNLKLVHYAIYTYTDCIDIISIEPPVIEWVLD